MKNITLAILKFAVALHRKAILAVVKAAEVRKEGAVYIHEKTLEAVKQTETHARLQTIAYIVAEADAAEELAKLPKL